MQYKRPARAPPEGPRIATEPNKFLRYSRMAGGEKVGMHRAPTHARACTPLQERHSEERDGLPGAVEGNNTGMTWARDERRR